MAFLTSKVKKILLESEENMKGGEEKGEDKRSFGSL